MNQMTNEEIARVFHLYFNPTSKIIINPETGIQYMCNSYQLNSMRGYMHEYKLLLRPLANITDKDAIDVARLTGMAMSEVLVKDTEGITMVDDGYELSIFFDGTIVMTKRGNPYAPNQCGLIDRLRELGYALPYKGKSLFDLGIAIKK